MESLNITQRNSLPRRVIIFCRWLALKFLFFFYRQGFEVRISKGRVITSKLTDSRGSHAKRKHGGRAHHDPGSDQYLGVSGRLVRQPRRASGLRLGLRLGLGLGPEGPTLAPTGASDNPQHSPWKSGLQRQAPNPASSVGIKSLETSYSILS